MLPCANSDRKGHQSTSGGVLRGLRDSEGHTSQIFESSVAEAYDLRDTEKASVKKTRDSLHHGCMGTSHLLQNMACIITMRSILPRALDRYVHIHIHIHTYIHTYLLSGPKSANRTSFVLFETPGPCERASSEYWWLWCLGLEAELVTRSRSQKLQDLGRFCGSLLL